ncbi:hypothetical protein HanPSC8_Chr07g0270221 [Helianthus annuus]|uniref:Uncharacterized protein n=1 Tax=Helianthus annuus TaxID=4232 RepID=A0A251U8U4_HELAN|nr:hypothetical protein HanPSC8_Chr07g0270221 [Helianthus annuus]
MLSWYKSREPLLRLHAFTERYSEISGPCGEFQVMKASVKTPCHLLKGLPVIGRLLAML